MRNFCGLFTLSSITAAVLGSLTLSGVDAHARSQSTTASQQDADFAALVAATDTTRGPRAEAFLEAHGDHASDARNAIAHSILGDVQWHDSCPLADRELCVEFRNPPVNTNTCAEPLRPQAITETRDVERAHEALVHLSEAIDRAEDAERPDDDVEAEILADAIARARVQQTDAEFEEFLAIGAPAQFDGDDPESVEAFRAFFTEGTRQGAALISAYAKVKRVGSPQWNLVAATRSGMIFETFADALYSIEMPEGLDEAQSSRYCETLDQQTAPMLTQAEQAYQWCIEYAETHEVGGPSLQTCRERLDVLTELANSSDDS